MFLFPLDNMYEMRGEECECDITQEEQEYEITGELNKGCTEHKETICKVGLMAQIKMVEMGITRKDAYVWYCNDLTHKPLVLGTIDEDNQTLKALSPFSLQKGLERGEGCHALSRRTKGGACGCEVWCKGGEYYHLPHISKMR
jgi:hypothetical protein